jgi:hypothetical protein
MLKFPLACLFILCSLLASAQIPLQSGFEKREYLHLLRFNSENVDIAGYTPGIEGPPAEYTLAYRSPEIGLKNRWVHWISEGKPDVLNVRGSIADLVSWVANIYAAMVPASGSLQLEKDFRFEYSLSKNPNAYVHVGWLVATAYLSRDMLPHLKRRVNEGQRDFLLMGHSQGGAICFLLNAFIREQMRLGALPADLRLKTYCSAAPKPGNLAFAYDFEWANRGGWAFTVVNSEDWVPETPVTIQTVNDFHPLNPFVGARKMIRQRNIAERVVLRKIFRNLTRPTQKAQQKYEKYLGRMVSRLVRQTLPEFEQPRYVKSSMYMRAGTPVVLRPDAAYFERFRSDPEKVFVHHSLEAYYTIAEQL